MRLRTGHTPDAWTPNEPAEHVSRHGPIGGSLVGYAPHRPMSEYQRQTIREARARVEARKTP